MKVQDFSGKHPDPRTFSKSRSVVTSDLVGVEVEMENAKAIEMKYWNAVDDGSLRDRGVEYIFSQPYAGVDVVHALDELEASVGTAFNPTFGERTSVHVHVDVRDLTKTQLMSFILMYMLFEKPLFKFCGEERETSNFCPSYHHAQGQIKALNVMFKSDSPGQVVRTLHGLERYASCNVNSISKFGSLEFRGHRGEYRKEPILNWINLLLSLKKSARTMNPNNIPYLTNKLGIEGLLSSVFGKKLSELIHYTGIESDILIGKKLVQDVLYYHRFTTASRKSGDKISESFKTYLGKKYPDRLSLLVSGDSIKESLMKTKRTITPGLFVETGGTIGGLTEEQRERTMRRMREYQLEVARRARTVEDVLFPADEDDEE